MALTTTELGALFPLTAEPRALRHLQVYENCPYAALQSPEGDILFHYGWRAMFHLAADRRRLRCAFNSPGDPATLRVLLDTVLWTASLASGLQLLHASAVRTPAGVVAICAASGGGKSSLAAEYLRRGATLYADDVVALEADGADVIGHPGPPVMNLGGGLAAAAPPGATELADFGDERWVQLDRVPERPAPLAAIVLLSRAAGHPLRCASVAATSLTLMPLSISLPHVGPGERHRFELFGQLAAATPVYSLTADLSVTPAELADAIDAQAGLR